MTPAPRHVVIVGGGSAGAMAAAMLAPLVARGIQVTLLDLPADRGLPGAAAVLPATRAWHRQLGIDEHALLRDARGGYRLGTIFADWSAPGDDWLLPFGDYGSPIDGIAFAELWLRAQAGGWPRPLEDYNIAALALRAGRFARATPDRLALIDYGYQLARAGHAAHLREHARRAGVAPVGGTLDGLERDADGSIAALIVGGRRIAGDFYIDTTDDGALVGADTTDWDGAPAGDQLTSLMAAPDPTLPPATDMRRSGSGWIQRVPLQHATCWSICSAADGPTALDHLRAASGSDAEPVIAAVRARQRPRPWAGNSVAIGRAAARIPPVFADPIDIARIDLAALVDLLPRAADPVTADIYAQRVATEYNQLRDLSAACLLPGGGGAGPMPDSLATTIARFRDGGPLPDPAPLWLAALAGRGILPRGWSAEAGAIAPERLRQNMIRLASLSAQSAESMPRHADYVARFCASGA